MSRLIRNAFPKLAKREWRETSPVSKAYNCIGWAAEPERQRWWWPDAMFQCYWPPGVPRTVSPAAFQEAFRLLGYEVTENEELEVGLEKVAFFVRAEEVTHAARQLPNGRWTSKLGAREDIEHHVLRALEGHDYGLASFIMARPKE